MGFIAYEEKNLLPLGSAFGDGPSYLAIFETFFGGKLFFCLSSKSLAYFSKFMKRLDIQQNGLST